MRKITISTIVLLVLASSLFAAPQWVSNPYDGLDRSSYYAAVGMGKTRGEAESAATGNLASIFGQSVQTSTSTYTSERTGGGRTDIADQMTSSSLASSSFSNIVGVEIHDFVSEGGTSYARAVMFIPDALMYYRSQVDTIYRRVMDSISSLQGREGDFTAYFSVLALYDDVAQFEEAKSILSVLSPSLITSYSDPRTALDGLRQSLRKSLSVAVEIEDDYQGAVRSAVIAYLGKAGIGTSSRTDTQHLIIGTFYYESFAGQRGLTTIEYEIELELYDDEADESLFSSIRTGRESHRSESRAMRTITSSLDEFVALMLDEHFYPASR